MRRTFSRLMTVSLVGMVVGSAFAGPPAPFTRDKQKPRSDRPAPFEPAKTYPEWAYDAPSYTRPVDEPKAQPRSRAKDPAHYFTSKPVIMVHQPEGYVAEEIPRVAIWYSRDNGYHWEKAGYFGRGETYYKLQVKKEGDYGIRFVGPGQEAAMEALPYPVCVHHVDMTAPRVTLSIDPEQAWYTPGQRLTVNWKATDPHLEAMPTRVSVITDWASDTVRPIEVAREQADVGSIEYTIPNNLGGDGFRFRVDAIDRAGNIGLAYSQTLQIVTDRIGDEEKPPVRMSTYSEPAVSTPMPAPVISTSPAPTAVTQQTAPTLEILPLEEIPVQTGWKPVEPSTPAASATTPTTSSPPTHGSVSAVSPASPAVQPTPSAPATPSTSSTSAGSSNTLELLPLMPIETPTSGGNTPVNTTPKAAPMPRESNDVELHSQVNSGVIRVTPAQAETPSQVVSDSVSASAKPAAIQAITVREMAGTNQYQPSHEQEVACDEEIEATEDEVDVEVIESTPMGEEEDDEVSDEQTNARLLKGRLIDEIRAAGLALGRLMAVARPVNSVSPAELVRGADVLVGGGLAAPMPATVISLTAAPPAGPEHAWRTLTANASRGGRAVWTLPRPVLGFELPRMLAREARRGIWEEARLKSGTTLGDTRIRAVAVSSDPD